MPPRIFDQPDALLDKSNLSWSIHKPCACCRARYRVNERIEGPSFSIIELEVLSLEVQKSSFRDILGIFSNVRARKEKTAFWPIFTRVLCNLLKANERPQNRSKPNFQSAAQDSRSRLVGKVV